MLVLQLGALDEGWWLLLQGVEHLLAVVVATLLNQELVGPQLVCVAEALLGRSVLIVRIEFLGVLSVTLRRIAASGYSFNGLMQVRFGLVLTTFAFA